MAESNRSDNTSRESIDDEVALLSRKFMQMMKKKGKFQHSSKGKGTRFKKKYKEENNEIIYFEYVSLQRQIKPQSEEESCSFWYALTQIMRDVGIDVPGMAPSIDTTQLKGTLTPQPSPFVSLPPQSPPPPPSQTYPKLSLSPINIKEATTFAKTMKKSLAEACKKAKLDETLEMKDAWELEEGVLASVKALFAKDHKKKLTEEARLAALVGKESKDIVEEVVLESLMTLSVEVLRKAVEEATMMEINGEPMPEVMIVESIQKNM
ncbi:hypothetical protein JHK86_009934 [Glycine max]|nr:hypothetical protein JHK86_009934 [Glycine max]